MGRTLDGVYVLTHSITICGVVVTREAMFLGIVAKSRCLEYIWYPIIEMSVWGTFGT